MNLLQEIRQRSRASANIPFDEWASWFQFNGLNYPILQQTLAAGGKQQEIIPGYSGFSDQALKANGIVFSCIATRVQLFAEAAFKFRPLGSYSSGDLFGTPTLLPLETAIVENVRRKE